jgi:hypothetical protein
LPDAHHESISGKANTAGIAQWRQSAGLEQPVTKVELSCSKCFGGARLAVQENYPAATHTEERRCMSGKGQWRNSYRGENGREDTNLLPWDNSADSSMEFAAGGSPFDPLWTPEQVARRLNVSADWVRDHSSRKEPRLPVIRLGGGPGRAGLLRYRASQIEKFIEEMERLGSRNSRRI